MLLELPTETYGICRVNIEGERMEETLTFLESKYAEFEPDQPFNYSFVDDKFARFYETETRLLKAIGFFSLISIVLTALGLFGMVTFVIERKLKEIGVRKVLGASGINISTTIILGNFSVLCLASLVSIPLALIAGNEWLSNFAYAVNVGALPFIIALSITILVVIGTVSLQAIKASRLNPVKALKSE